MKRKRKTAVRTPLGELSSHVMLHPGRTERIDFLFLMLVVVLLLFGVIMLFSASQNTSVSDIYGKFASQIRFAAIGLVLMIIISRIDYHVYRRWAPMLFGVIMVAMYAVPIVGFASHGATRQISIGPVSFQPSEICKYCLVIYFAALLSTKKQNDLTNWRNVLRFAIYLGLIVVACILQSHLSAMLLIVGTGFVMLLAAGLPKKYSLFLGGAFVVGGVLLAVFEPYRLRRLLIFTDPFSDKRGDGWQIVNSLYAVGSGGLTGVGFGQSRQKYGYLPEAQNDYIYAIVCEELGFIGGVAVILLFAMLVIRGVQIALASKDTFGMYLGFGIMSIIALQVLVNVGVVLSVLPSTGMQLPFFSSGGTSMVITLAAMGIMMNISRFSTQNKI